MPNSDINRRVSTTAVTISNGAALSAAIDMRGYAGGVISMPSSWTSASLGFKHSHDLNGTYQPLYDDTGTLIAITASASKDFAIPDKVFGCAFIKLWSETTAADANQGADRSIIVTLKS